ncbi:hypothetical protein [Plantactinospora sp. KLBMP9567]|uniref:hypothetical protein n=1 Tax=Plantactinospora sp. KLBMP9567 TaxID=3085900 RepID=UPI0029827FA6|nr:hypothetical protein [Plantactinospora sp. KLBMP9567]MDW5324258.1 hypothetical protein [Plantactinospora sp. KLBMP9567]
MRKPNNMLRAVRLRRSSPSGSGRPMSRQEVAEGLNSVLFEQTGKVYALDANYVGKLERGVIRWPQPEYRQALRTLFDAATDADLGLYLLRGWDKVPDVAPKLGNADPESVQSRAPMPMSVRPTTVPVAVTVTVTAGEAGSVRVLIDTTPPSDGPIESKSALPGGARVYSLARARQARAARAG